MKFLQFSQTKLGSSFVSLAYGWSGTRATINYDSPAAEKNRAKPEGKRAKRKRGVEKMNFCPLACPPKAGCGVGAFPQFLRQQKGKTEKFSFP